MQKLVLLYWGCIFLMYLSELYYPAGCLPERQSRRSFMWRKADLFMVLAIAWMTCFSFLRTRYNDTETYVHMFNEAVSLSEGFANGLFVDWANDAWSQMYMSLMHTVTDNYHIFFLVPALMLGMGTIKVLKAYSVNPVFSLLLFFSIGTYVTYIAAMKQCMSMFFLLLALPYLVDRKYVKFYLLTVVAFLFHTYAAIFFIMPLLVYRPWGKVTFTLLLGTVLLIRFYDPVMHTIVDAAARIGMDMKEEEIFYDHQLSILRVLVYFIPAILAFFFQRRLFSDSERQENIFANMSIMSGFVMMVGLVKGANLYSRMAAYFEIGTAISLPWMLQKILDRKSAQLVTIIAAVLYFGYFLFEFGINKNFGAEYAAISLWDFARELLA